MPEEGLKEGNFMGWPNKSYQAHAQISTNKCQCLCTLIKGAHARVSLPWRVSAHLTARVSVPPCACVSAAACARVLVYLPVFVEYWRSGSWQNLAN